MKKLPVRSLACASAAMVCLALPARADPRLAGSIRSTGEYGQPFCRSKDDLPTYVYLVAKTAERYQASLDCQWLEARQRVEILEDTSLNFRLGSFDEPPPVLKEEDLQRSLNHLVRIRIRISGRVAEGYVLSSTLEKHD